jgi:hypothetical protein
MNYSEVLLTVEYSGFINIPEDLNFQERTLDCTRGDINTDF